jgi:hypothetical protein
MRSKFRYYRKGIVLVPGILHAEYIQQRGVSANFLPSIFYNLYVRNFYQDFYRQHIII